jgi:hypothetical protein
MKSKKVFYSAVILTTLCLLGIGSSYYSRSACEYRTVADVLIFGRASSPPRLSAHKTVINGKTYDYTDSKEIVDNTLRCYPRLQSMLIPRQTESDGSDLVDEDCFLVFSFSHGKVIFPFIVATDVEVKYTPREGFRTYYFTFYGYVRKITHRAIYRV